jgi:hypothetical protein
MKMPKVWKIMTNFKNSCKDHGWKTSETEDWVEADEEYHNFLCAKSIHPSCFRSIIKSGKCVIREGLSYRVVEASYTAWLLSEPPSEALTNAIFENPELPKRVAVYDLSPLFEGQNKCFKLNNTESNVFNEFESFLAKKMKVKFEPFYVQEEAAEDCPIANVA